MKILVGLSWGVDSAIAAYLLKEQWYEVVAGFMKNYVSETWNCTTYDDSKEAIKVADFLWIEIQAFDFIKEYQERIIDYIYQGYKKGITPNPDVLCNSLIKFDVFLEKALEKWFDKIATGHYAQLEEKGGVYHLIRWKDHNKDQTYFLAGLNQYQLQHSLFPIGHLTKPEVRELAKKINLPNAERKDSQWLCFIGNVPIKNFLMNKFPVKRWEIRTLEGKVVWEHDWAYFFTIWQKHGLWLNFKAYVYRIDIENNIVYVCDKDSEELLSQDILVKDWTWIAEEYQENVALTWKIRYRQNPPVECHISKKDATHLNIHFNELQRAVAPWQVFVLYDWEICLWSGIIS
jgi:tRNA-specific 2-thiouridylase